jgi:hypothetical protein
VQSLRLLAASAAITLALASCARAGGPAAAEPSADAGGPLQINSGPAPWPAPDRERARAEAAGLKLGEEGTARHFHTHLDVFVDGVSIAVPVLGFADCCVSPLHTHTQSGILHIESNDTAAVYTLGQVFALWGIRLSDDCIGGYCRPSVPISLYVNGVKQAGAIADLQLAPGAEIAVVIGREPSLIPISYDCANAGDIEIRSCSQSFK